MGKFQDLSGMRFERLTVVKRDYEKEEQRILEGKKKRVYWICKCVCGNHVSVSTDNLKNGHTKSCGCLQKEFSKNKNENLKGVKFGRLTVIERDIKKEQMRVSEGKNKVAYWICKCECGNIISVPTNNLKNGNTKSCGCYNLDNIIKRNEEIKNNNIGKRFGKLTILSYDENGSTKKNTRYICKCDCGTVKSIQWSNLKSGCTTSCGCIASKGEYRISQYLNKINLKFESQKIYPNLIGVNNGNLSYDFYLPDYNLLIEFQGEQHEKPQRFPNCDNEAKFKIQQEHDKRKREYAKENNIELLEIWYYDYENIENILENKLKGDVK